ncbi:MAG: ketopantoate reductase family protein [Oscillospiraceae bacterium]|nr:ketopantoate reductase family protein [Oscillospiraceae bacterium]MDY3219310.1 ketopantoate reductase family protein [Candidatus Fimivivens sp.]
MKIAIMGTGTMACLFGGRMFQQGHEVWLVSGWKEQVETILQSGLVLSEAGRDDLVLHPHVTLHAQDVVAGGAGYPELVMISCKGYQTVRTVANALPLIGPDTRVLTLQNGMGNAEIIAERVPVEHVFFGAASVAADSHELGHVVDTTNHNRIPLIGIAPLSRREDPFCDVLEKLFVSLGYTTSASVASEQFVWKKLCLNSCGNALAGISQLSNHIFSNDQDAFILLNQICAECCAVAQAKGISLDYNETRAYVHATYYRQQHYVSMCQDIHNKRKTEIDTINGTIVRLGRQLGIPTPVNETMVHLVRLISNHYADQWQ